MSKRSLLLGTFITALIIGQASQSDELDPYCSQRYFNERGRPAETLEEFHARIAADPRCAPAKTEESVEAATRKVVSPSQSPVVSKSTPFSELPDAKLSAFPRVTLTLGKDFQLPVASHINRFVDGKLVISRGFNPLKPDTKQCVISTKPGPKGPTESSWQIRKGKQLILARAQGKETRVDWQSYSSMFFNHESVNKKILDDELNGIYTFGHSPCCGSSPSALSFSGNTSTDGEYFYFSPENDQDKSVARITCSESVTLKDLKGIFGDYLDSVELPVIEGKKPPSQKPRRSTLPAGHAPAGEHEMPTSEQAS